MKWVQRAAVTAAILVAAPVLGAASINETTAGYTYFNKPGADTAAHDADVAACTRFAGTTLQPAESVAVPYVPNTGVLGAAVVAGASAAIAQGMATRHARPVNIEDCMVAKGWRVVVLDPNEGSGLAALKPVDRRHTLDQWVGSATPHGTITRVFANEAVDGGTPALTFARLNGHPFGMETATRIPEPDVRLDPDDPTASSTEPYEVKHVRQIKIESLDRAPTDAGLIVVKIADAPGLRLVFERVDKDGREIHDHEAAEFTVSQPAEAQQGNVLVYAAAPGRWRLAGFVRGYFSVNLCFGGPSIVLADHAVVYLGAFDPAHGSLAPDMDLAAVTPLFPANSPVAAVLRPADWINGSVGRCRGTYIYALEFPDRPFIDGYQMGSQARSAASAGH